MSKSLVAATEKFGMQAIYGQLQVDEVLQLSSLAHTLDIISDTPVEGLFLSFYLYMYNVIIFKELHFLKKCSNLHIFKSRIPLWTLQ